MQELLIVLAAGWFILNVIGNWLLFKKAGKHGWHSLIPFLNIWEEYDLCWEGSKGILYLLLMIGINMVPSSTENIMIIVITFLAGMWMLTLNFRQSMRLAKAFGKGKGYGWFLFFFDRIGRIILGLGSAEYVGK